MSFANSEVFIGKLVGDVPADGAKLPSVLDDGMEETEAEQQFFELA